MKGKRALASLGAVALVLAACGDDDDSSDADDAPADTEAAADETDAGGETGDTDAPADSDAPDDTDAAAEGDGGGESSGEVVVVEVGVPLDITGPAAISNIGSSELNGMELALAEVEEEGFLEGFDIEIVSVDTKADKQEAVAGVLKLVEEDDVDAIVGFTLTPSFLAAAPQAVDTGMPVVAAGLAGAGVTDLGENVFRIIPNVVSLYLESDAAFTDAFGSTKAAYLYTSDSETTAGIHGARKGGMEAAGIETVSEQTTSTDDTEYRAQLTEMANSGADVIVITAFPGQFAGIYLQAEELGIDIPIISSDGTGRDEVLDQAGGAMQCVVYNAVWAAQNETGRNPHFVEAIQEAYDDEADLYYAAGYDAMWMFATALQEAGSAEPAAVIAALNGVTDFEGAFGVYDFNENREPTIAGINLMIDGGEIVVWDPDATCER